MKYDVLHLPGPPTGGCGEVTITPELADDHDRGDRITIKCRHCGRVGAHEVRYPLRGLARLEASDDTTRPTASDSSG